MVVCVFLESSTVRLSCQIICVKLLVVFPYYRFDVGKLNVARFIPDTNHLDHETLDPISSFCFSFIEIVLTCVNLRYTYDDLMMI